MDGITDSMDMFEQAPGDGEGQGSLACCRPQGHTTEQLNANGSSHPLEKDNGNPLQYLAWRSPWAEETGRLLSIGSQRVGHRKVLATNTFTFASKLTQFLPRARQH